MPRRQDINIIEGMKPKIVIYTDLDGTLLDHKTYSWKAAQPALNLIRENDIPLVLCSSKTRAEMERIRTDLDNHAPFIAENGGAIFIPMDYFVCIVPRYKVTGQYQVIELGTSYTRLRQALVEIAQQTCAALKGFGDLTVEEIAAQTGLPIEEAWLAKHREYDEPFILEGTESQKQQVLQMIQQRGLRFSRGGRFHHLTGDNDKGQAVRILSGLFKQKYGKVFTVAVGDSLNDLPMLEAVEHPILVQKQKGQYETSIALPGLIRAEGIGPEGWNHAVLKLLASANF